MNCEGGLEFHYSLEGWIFDVGKGLLEEREYKVTAILLKDTVILGRSHLAATVLTYVFCLCGVFFFV